MKKIRFQLASWYSLGILATILVLLLLFYQATQIVFYRQVDETLKVHLTAEAQAVEQGAKSQGCNCLSGQSSFLEGILNMPGMPTAIFDDNGQMLKASLDWQSPKSSLSSHRSNEYFNDQIAGLSYRFLTLSVQVNGQQIGSILMGHPIEAFLQTRNLLAIVMAILLLLMVLPVIFLGRLLAERALAKEKQFLSDMAHSLKTPLAVLQSQLEGPAQTNRADLLAGVQKISRLVTETLETAYAESNEKKGAVDLSLLLEELVEIGQHLGDKKKIKVVKEIPESPIFTTGNQQKLAKAILAILENAIQYGKKGGKVRVSLRQENRQTIIHISDNGPGIDPVDLPFVFQRFYRGHNAQANSSGLGLSIAKNIIENLGGEISLQSEKGRGSTVTISLPRRQAGLIIS